MSKSFFFFAFAKSLFSGSFFVHESAFNELSMYSAILFCSPLIANSFWEWKRQAASLWGKQRWGCRAVAFAFALFTTALRSQRQEGTVDEFRSASLSNSAMLSTPKMRLVYQLNLSHIVQSLLHSLYPSIASQFVDVGTPQLVDIGMNKHDKTCNILQ